MPTLDYPRPLSGGDDDGERQIIVPSFHTGALGYVPGSEIRIGLSHSSVGEDDRGRPTEVLATPFDWEEQSAFRLVATFRDSRGVVKRLLDSIWALGINILSGDTCTIAGGRLHYCEFLLDWQPSRYRTLVDGRPSDQELYAGLASRIPIDQARYVCLFKSILLGCSEVIHYDRIGSSPQPSVFMQPLSHRSLHVSLQGTVDKPADARPSGDDPPPGSGAGTDVFRAALPINSRHYDMIRRRGGWQADDDPVYIVSSDPVTRTLRAHFPSKEAASRLVHLGFDHADEPGALSTMAGCLAAAGFNLLQSLLRKRTTQQSTWEILALVEGAGDRHPPADQDEMVEWVGERIRTAGTAIPPKQGAQLLEHLAYYQVSVGLPLYPRRGDKKVAIAPRDTEEIPPSPLERDVGALAATYESDDPDVERVLVNARDFRTARRAYEVDVFSRHNDPRPRVFLSYPGKAGGGHADVLRSLLEDMGFKVLVYQSPDGQRLIEEARRRILRSDYFIGLWLPDIPEKDYDHPAPSPWLTLELGIAMGRPGWEEHNQLWAASAKVDERLRLRFQQDTVHWTVEDDPEEFRLHSAKDIAARARREWLEKYRFDRLELQAQ